eukprot:gb/GECH01001815.1/.p1 GENE.gb/GECH01001815.1/~~gb/GECH01001815.1/.p1  ORF type:complete len:375 (+),score=59.11 gb/GECH01001815.1/:1-1125(+)
MDYDDTAYEVPSEPDVGDKYRTAADIANRSLSAVLDQVAPGQQIAMVCEQGDATIRRALREVYPQVRHKGVAFPTCISPGRLVCHYSPGPDDNNQNQNQDQDQDAPVYLKAGQLVRVELGVHIDGYLAQVGHTVQLPANDTTGDGDATPITGPVADAMAACEVGAAAAMRLLQPGNSSTDVTRAWEKAAANFGVTAVDGVLSHEVKRYVMDGSRCIIQAETAEHATEAFTLAADQVLVVDLVMASAASASLTEADVRPHIYKRTPDVTYPLRLKSARQVFSAAVHQFHGMPFPMRALDRRQGKLGISECWQHHLVDALPILRTGRRTDAVVRCTFTVVITPDGPVRLTGHDWQRYQSDRSLEDPDLQQLLHTSS